ncbi:MAG: hypothetical protein WC548_04165 [Candidatus Pacearchaeota archaeon]
MVSKSKKGFLEKLEDPKSNFTFNVISLSIAFLVVILCILYVISCWSTPDKIFALIEKIILIFAGLLGGRSLVKNGN